VVSIDRYRRARLAGAGPLSRDGWAEIVAAAVAAAEKANPWLCPTFEAVKPEDIPRREYTQLMPGQMVIDARTVLAVEAALAEAELLADELRTAAAEDLDSARRARMLRTIEAAGEAVAKRLKRGSC